jgi:RHS repeat-associated protein
VISTRRYDAVGTFELGAANGYAFTGREWDTQTGLYYYRARYYDPKIGRFISEDPIGVMGGMNFYAYVENRPTLFIDPSGLSGIPIDRDCAQAQLQSLMTGGLGGPPYNPGEPRHNHCLFSCMIAKNCKHDDERGCWNREGAG